MSRKPQPLYADDALIAASRLTPAEMLSIEEDVLRSLRDAQARVVEAAARGGAEQRAAQPLPPAGNTGGKSMEEGGAASVPPRFILVDGRPFEVPGRRGWGGDSAFIDWINFTAQEEAFFQGSTPVADDQVVMDHVSPVCREIFGFGVSHQRDNGANFYRDSYVLGDGYGIVCHGGQRGTVLISISGEGCAAAKEGWEERLRQWLEAHKAVARITRIDLAHDDYDGALTVDQLDQLFDQGGFNCGGRNPDVEHRGNWKHPNGKGRTLYVGNRRNGKFFRGYEKGKQLGDPASNWLRLEVEFKSVDREIPFDVLTRAGEYLAAAYPCLAFISEHQERIITTQKTMQITYASMCEWLRRQCGAAINVALEMEGSLEAFITKCVRVGEMPKRLHVPHFGFACETSKPNKTRPLAQDHYEMEAALQVPFNPGQVSFLTA